MELVVVQGDSLEFNFEVVDNAGNPYELKEGEQYFFMARPSCGSGECVIHELRSSNYFLIKRVDLMPGIYEFDAGIKFADGTTLTVIDAETGSLKVKRKTGER